MSAMYPSLEDMKLDHMAQAQVAAARVQAQPGVPVGLYAGLGLEELLDYGGFNISAGALEKYMPADMALQVTSGTYEPIVAITASDNIGMRRAEVKHGVRQVILAKDQAGKVGLAVQAIDKGIFVAFVYKESAAAMAGMRLGDQILQINGENVAGWSSDKTLKTLRKADGASIAIALRDRPFARAITVVKDSSNQVGFVFNKGQITAIVKDSSAARNGMLIHHALMEVNGVNVVFLSDDAILQLLRDSPRSLTITILPTCIYEHLVKSIGSKRLKECMDRSTPEL